MISLYISWKHLLWLALSPILLWPIKAYWDWFRHCFWLGFKAGVVATWKKGGALTPEEQAAIKAQVNAQIQAEINAKITAVTGPLGINLSNADTAPAQTLPPDNKS
jgi:hypothetical protein